MRLYADEGDLDDWVDDAPDNADLLIQYASVLVEQATRNDVYSTDGSGMPDQEDVVSALRVAVCVQVAGWLAADVNPLAGSAGVASAVASTSLLSASVSYEAGSVNRARQASAQSLMPAAVQVLRNAGLAGSAVTCG